MSTRLYTQLKEEVIDDRLRVSKHSRKVKQKREKGSVKFCLKEFPDMPIIVLWQSDESVRVGGLVSIFPWLFVNGYMIHFKVNSTECDFCNHLFTRDLHASFHWVMIFSHCSYFSPILALGIIIIIIIIYMVLLKAHASIESCCVHFFFKL